MFPLSSSLGWVGMARLDMTEHTDSVESSQQNWNLTVVWCPGGGQGPSLHYRWGLATSIPAATLSLWQADGDCGRLTSSAWCDPGDP